MLQAFQDLIPIKPKVRSYFGSTVKQAVGAMSTSPLANIRAAVGKVKNFYGSRQDTYDALALSMANVEEQYDAAAESKLNYVDDDVAIADRMVDLGYDSAVNFAAGVYQAAYNAEMERLINDGYSESQAQQIIDSNGGAINFAISDAKGQVYDIRVNQEALVRMKMQESYDEAIIYQETISGQVDLLKSDANGIVSMATSMTPKNYLDERIVGVFSGKVLDCINELMFTLSSTTMEEEGLSTVCEGCSFIAASLSVGTSENEPILNILQSCVRKVAVGIIVPSTIGGCFNMLLKTIKSSAGKAILTATPFISVARDMVTTADINATLNDLCDCALSSDPAQSVRDYMQRAQDKSKAVKSIVHGAIDAIRIGGIRGLVQYILNYIRGGTTLYNEDGTINFTNNGAFIPKEFIAGIVGAVLSAVADAIVIIGLVFKNVFMVVGSLLVKLSLSVFSSIKSTHDDTYASIYVDNDANTLEIRPYAPFAVYRFRMSKDGAFNHSMFNQMLATYQTFGTPFELPVPGGALFVGPTQIDDITSEVIEFGLEFHPAILNLQQVVFKNYIQDLSGFDSSSGEFDFYDMSKNFFSEIWNRVLSSSDVEYFSNGSSGHLGSTDDAILRASLCVEIGLFNLWLVQSSTELFSSGKPLHLDPTLFTSDDFLQYCTWMAGQAFSQQVISSSFSLGWTEFLNCLNAVNEMDQVTFALWSNGFDKWIYNNNHVISLENFLNNVSATGYVFDPVPLPSVIRFAMICPVYNGTTYWTWLLLASIAVAAVSAAVAVVAVKFTKFAKAKRAQNLARFNEAQSDYQEAVSGRESYIDSEGNMKYREFDVSSAEGQEKIKSYWKTYKRTAFKNNLWANIIGGSRYDVSTFWGEKEVSDDSGTELPDPEESFGVTSFNNLRVNSDDDVIDDSDQLLHADVSAHAVAEANSDPIVSNATLEDILQTLLLLIKGPVQPQN